MAEENTISNDLIISNAPHIRDNQSVNHIMWMVNLSLLPAAVFAVYTYGLSALYMMLGCILGAVLAEAASQKLMKKAVTINDGSALLTGLLLAFNIPPNAPVWMGFIGSVFAIFIAKQLFGGLGFNIFNPALAGRAFLMASWPVYMTTYWHKFSPTNVLSSTVTNISNLPKEAFDVVTGATPLGAFKEVPKLLADMGVSPDSIYQILFSNQMFKSLFIGNIGGVIGETSVLFLLIGAAFLLFKKIITWEIPVSYMGTVAVFMLLFYSLTGFAYPIKVTLFHLLAGGLVLGAFYMATDMVTSPVSRKGMIIFGIGCGLLTCVIRIWGGYPEGVSYSILLMNAAVPLIEKYTRPRIFGTVKTAEQPKEEKKH